MATTNLSYAPPHTSVHGGGGIRRNSGDFLINDTAAFYVNLFFKYILQMPLQAFGIGANLINIVVFLDIGLKDSLTVTLFGLSVADLFNLACYLTFHLLFLCMGAVDLKTRLFLGQLAFAVLWYSVYFNDVSMYLTVFSAVQKCHCVSRPLQFKAVFTRKAGAVGTLAVYVAILAIMAPVLSAITFELQTNSSSGAVAVVGKGVDGRYLLSHYQLAMTVWRWLSRVGLTVCGQLAIVVCCGVIVVSLEKSARFRRSTQSQSQSGANYNNNSSNNNNNNAASGDSSTEPPSLISRNEMKAIRAVQLLSYIFVVTKIPVTAASMTTEFLPGFESPYYENVRTLLLSFALSTGTINASINVFVYFKYNSKYKRALLDIFGLLKKTDRMPAKENLFSTTATTVN